MRSRHRLALAIALTGLRSASAQEAQGSFFHHSATPSTNSAPAPTSQASPNQTAPAPAQTSSAPEAKPTEPASPTASQAALPTQPVQAADRCGSSSAAVLAFARAYYANGSSDSIPDVLTYDQQAYSDQVDYYGKPFTRADVLKDKTAYLKRWPTRSYALNGAPDIHCNQATSVYDFTGRVAWSARNPSKPAMPVKAGISLVQLGIVAQPPEIMKIVRESGKVIQRTPDQPQ